MTISHFRLFYKLITFYYAFYGATFSRHAVSLYSQRYFTQARLHEKKSPSYRKENARTFFQTFSTTTTKNEHGWFKKGLLQLKPNWISKTVRYTRLITQQPTKTHESRSHTSYFWKRIFGKENVVEARHLLLAQLAEVYFTRTCIYKDQRPTRGSQDERHKKIQQLMLKFVPYLHLWTKTGWPEHSAFV